MKLKETIQRLHVGQLVIVALVAAGAVGLLLPARARAKRDKNLSDWVASAFERRGDSLYGAGYLRARAQCAEPERVDTAVDRFAWLDPCADETKFVASRAMVSQYKENAAEGSDALLRLIVLDGAILLITALPIGILWAWFDGRPAKFT